MIDYINLFYFNLGKIFYKVMSDLLPTDVSIVDTQHVNEWDIFI